MSDRVSKVGDLRIGSRAVNIDVKVLNKTEERQITSRTDGSNHRVTEALVGDETGCILLTLWDNMIDEVAANDKIKIENGYVSLFKGSMRLNVGRYGKISKVEADLPEVNTKNNLSERVIERRFGEERGQRGDRFGKRRFRRY